MLTRYMEEVGVLFYPSGGIATIGLGASLTVFLCAATNLMLTPSLISAFPGFFGAENARSRIERRAGRRCGRISCCSGGCWQRIAHVVTKQPGVILIPIACLAFLLPACAVLLHYHESFANTLTFPAKSDTSLAYHQLISEFPAGKLSPQHPFGLITAEVLLSLPGDVGESYREQWNKLVSYKTGEHSSLLMLTVPFDPFSDTLWPFVIAARNAIAKATGNRTADAHVLGRGIMTTVDDAQSNVMLFGTLTVVFDIVVVPLAAVFGIAVWVYQFGALDWLPGGPGNNPFTSPPGGGFYWAAPVFTCTIIIGLALDYDVFLFARVIELRKKGYSNPAAVRGGLTLTGPTITAAGLIMAIAFGGLLLSDVPSNNQIGFVMAFGDTFVIRTCLVPSVLTLAASLNYWPQRMPEPGPLEVEMLQHDCDNDEPFSR
eukprot:s893_g7.t1